MIGMNNLTLCSNSRPFDTRAFNIFMGVRSSRVELSMLAGTHPDWGTRCYVHPGGIDTFPSRCEPARSSISMEFKTIQIEGVIKSQL